MKTTLRNSFLSTVGSLKTISSGIHVLNSHYIGRGDISADIFYDLLSELNKSADFIKIEDAVNLIQKRQRLNEKLIAFTFDDGFEECFSKIAPVLKDFNTNAAFFINPGYIDGDKDYIQNFNTNIVHVNKRPMSWENIKALYKDGFIIGNHTYDHARLVNLSNKEVEQQIINSKKIIEQKIDAKCDYFAWTYGKMSDIDRYAMEIALKEHAYVFSSDNYTQYYSNNNSKIINRRHIEGDWPISHVKYFLSKIKSY